MVSVALLSVAVTSPSLDYGFVYDDQQVIVDRKPFWEEGWREFLHTRHWGTGRHLSLLSLDLDRSDPLSPRPFHRSNVLLAAAVSVAVLLLALELGAGMAAAVLAAMLFAVHPAHADTVASLVGRAQLLATLGVILGLLIHLRGLRHGNERSPLRLLGGGLCFFLALHSKESAAVLPLLLLLHHFTIGQAAGRRLPWATLLTYALAFALWLSTTLPLLSGITPIPFVDNPLASMAWWERIPKASLILWQYLSLLLLPTQLLPNRGFAVTNPGLGAAVGGLAAWIVLLIAVLRYRLRFPRAAFCGLWFVVAFAATSNLVFPIGTIMAERLLYLPSVGLCIASTMWLDELDRVCASGIARWIRRSAVTLAAATVVLLAFLYDARARVWTSQDYYHEQAAAQSPASAKAYYDLAAQCLARGDAAGAESAYRRALDIIPGFDRATFYLAQILTRQGRAHEAVEVYRDYLRVHPGDPAGLTNLISSLLIAGEREAALVEARRLVQLHPEDDQHRRLLAFVEAAGLATTQSLNASSATGNR